MSLEYLKPERILLLGNPELSEKWVQARIAEDPTLLGLGDLILKDKERIQPRAGRLDLLFQDAETTRRYEVEIQLARPTKRTSFEPLSTGTLNGSVILSTITPL